MKTQCHVTDHQKTNGCLPVLASSLTLLLSSLNAFIQVFPLSRLFRVEYVPLFLLEVIDFPSVVKG